MAYLVVHLAEHGYVKISVDPADGRAKLIQLTSRGLSFIKTLFAATARLEKNLAGDWEMQNFKPCAPASKCWIKLSPTCPPPDNETRISNQQNFVA